MLSPYNFDDIRPYNDNEVNTKINLLLKDPIFDEVLLNLFNDQSTVNEIKKQLSKIQTIKEVQFGFIYDLIEMIIQTTTKGLTSSGLENLDKKKPYLFISNHRDIILDSAFLNYLIFRNGMNTTQIAIGDNLFIYDWIIHAVKLNRAFVVKRNIGVRELLESSKKLSHYIRSSIIQNNTSVWIAQREGRTKDGHDQTQVSLLKMLNMSNINNFVTGFKELNIVPISISYELEPCDISKIKEEIKKAQNDFYKTSKDDLKSMAFGVKNPKGRIHFSFGKPILPELENQDSDNKNELFENLARIIDTKIYSQYKLWPLNYVAYDLLNKNKRFNNKYTLEDKARFEEMINNAVLKIDTNPIETRERFIKLYANPVNNAIQTNESTK